ncbi:hypothetical protein [Chitinimonas naiadis]
MPSESYAEFTIFDDDEGDMEVVRESEHELIVRGSNRVLIIDKRKRTISGIDKLLALFNDVQAVQIRRHAQRHGWPDTYTVAIITGRRGTLNLGRTIDEVDASIMAAKLGTWLGATVRS